MVFLALAGLNAWGLRLALRARHYLGLFGAWQHTWSPQAPQEAALAGAARQAFDQGDFKQAAALAERAGARAAGPGPVLNLSHALALAGETVQAAELLTQAQDRRQRWLLPQRRFWRMRPAYFQAGQAPGLWNPAAVLGRAALCALLVLPLVSFRVGKLGAAWERATATFSAKGFERSVQGPFTFFYHDPAFLAQARDIAIDALEHDLRFYGLPESVFGPGQIKVYLCDSAQEYLQRSPYTREWEAGSAVAATHSVYLYRLPPEQGWYFEVVLAHELAHLIFHRVAPQHRSDSWLNEGQASYLGYQFALGRQGLPMQSWLKQNEFKPLQKSSLPFKAFLADDPQRGLAVDKIPLFYAQGFSIVNVLIEYYGREEFLAFVRAYGRLGDLDPALKETYPTLKNGLADLQGVWQLFITND